MLRMVQRQMNAARATLSAYLGAVPVHQMPVHFAPQPHPLLRRGIASQGVILARLQQLQEEVLHRLARIIRLAPTAQGMTYQHLPVFAAYFLVNA
jgi:hypothetical protein